MAKVIAVAEVLAVGGYLSPAKIEERLKTSVRAQPLGPKRMVILIYLNGADC